MNRWNTLLQLTDFMGVYIDTKYPVTYVSQSGSLHKSDITGAKYVTSMLACLVWSNESETAGVNSV